MASEPRVLARLQVGQGWAEALSSWEGVAPGDLWEDAGHVSAADHGEMCDTHNPYGAYTCTLDVGHLGPHIATDGHMICSDIWAIWRDLAHPSLRVSAGL